MIPNLMYTPRWIETAPCEMIQDSEGCSFFSDLGGYEGSHPYVWNIRDANRLYRYDPRSKSWNYEDVAGIGVGFGTGSAGAFLPSGASELSFNISTTNTLYIGSYNASQGGWLAPNSLVGAKALVSYHDGISTYRQWLTTIVGNTGHDAAGDGQFQIRIDPPLPSTSGWAGLCKVFGFGEVLGCGSGVRASGIWRTFNTMNNKWTSVNMGSGSDSPSVIGVQTNLVVLDPTYVPYNRHPIEGIIGTATRDSNGPFRCLKIGSGSTDDVWVTAPGCGDDDVQANEFVGCQIRFVENTQFPCEFQRGILAHTAGPQVQWTLTSGFGAAPIQGDSFIIFHPAITFVWTNGNVTTFHRAHGSFFRPDTVILNNGDWSSGRFPVRPVGLGAGGVTFSSAGMVRDPSRGIRSSHLHCFQGGGNSRLDIMDWCDISWQYNVEHESRLAGFALSTGSCGVCVQGTEEGRYCYINNYNTGIANQMRVYDMFSRKIVPHTSTDRVQTGTQIISSRMAAITSEGRSTLFLNYLRSQNFLEYPINPTR